MKIAGQGHIRQIGLPVILSAIVFVPIALPAADWPQWRGPNRDAVSAETGLLKEWPAEGPALAWELSGLGKGLSSVAIAGGKLITMGNKDDGQQYLLAFDLDQRTPIWKAQVLALSVTSDQPRKPLWPPLAMMRPLAVKVSG